jgi:hypothetical protein
MFIFITFFLYRSYRTQLPQIRQGGEIQGCQLLPAIPWQKSVRFLPSLLAEAAQVKPRMNTQLREHL